MRALRSFTVRASLPEPLQPLRELAMNLRWSWSSQARDVFRWIDPDAWEITGHDPVRLLGLAGRDRLDELAHDVAFLSFLREVRADLDGHLTADLWFQQKGDQTLRHVAYFSPEFGIAEALPQYSGGLGVLAGDHLKAASGLGLPLVGVGLLYRQGYFRQELNLDGWQQERYPTLDPHAMAVAPVDGAKIEVDLAGTPLVAQVWRADVGRIRLYLLDADCEENGVEERLVTDRLYGGDPQEHRIRQEILLGIGGVRALEAVGEDAQVFHTNEGHAGFLGLERIRRLITKEGLAFEEAIEAVRASTIFTTHTPVPAGIDRFRHEVMHRYFRSWSEECGVPFDRLMALGHRETDAPEDPFNMAVMGFRLAGMSNGVSRLHGEVSRSMFHDLWPAVAVDEVPITSITNGVHALTWVSPEMDELLDRYVTPAWWEADAEDWARIEDARDDELWRVREQGRERLVSLVRTRLRASAAARGVSESELGWTDDALDPRILTIGFARRFATYKRATLLLSQPERLKALLLSVDRPIQLVFAGKAHPADDAGKEMIREIVQLSHDPSIRHRIAFVENYDIEVARAFYQGSDVWLNTPRRPLEACGTSGEKAALNGALNCSILDGWWDEMFDGENGWAISSAETVDDLSRRDEIEAASLFDLLEHQIIPLFYERDGHVPRRWVKKVKTNLISLGPQVTAARMVRDYVEKLYTPTAARAIAMEADGYEGARRLAAWKRRVRAAWPAVRILTVESNESLASLGEDRAVEAVVDLGALDVDDVEVQLIHGPVGPTGEIMTTSMTAMDLDGGSDGPVRAVGSFRCELAGRYGFSVRVVPHHADLPSFSELGLAVTA